MTFTDGISLFARVFSSKTVPSHCNGSHSNIDWASNIYKDFVNSIRNSKGAFLKYLVLCSRDYQQFRVELQSSGAQLIDGEQLSDSQVHILALGHCNCSIKQYVGGL